MSGKQISTLHFSVRPKCICKYLGQLLIVYAFLQIVPLIFSILTGDYQLAAPYAFIILVSGVTGLLLQKFEVSSEVQHNEILVISALIFILASLLSAVPFYYSGLDRTDSLFESVSGITTTGLSSLASVESLPRTLLFFRSWLQWIGGLGIVVLGVGLLMPNSKGTLYLFRDNWENDRFMANTRSYARIILMIYLGMTAAGFILLLILGTHWYDALLHVLASVSTGGFSNYDESLAGLSDKWIIQAVIVFISCLGAVPLILYYTFFKQGLRESIGSAEFAGLAAAAFVAMAATIITLAASDGLSVHNAIAEGSLLALSAQTTTGFSTLPVPSLSPPSKFILILFMFAGGNVGSTAGGIKIIRLLIIMQLIKLLIIRSGLPPSAVYQTRIMGRSLNTDEIERCLVLTLVFAITILLSTMPFIYIGYPFLDSLFEVVSAVCTVGLSAGVTSPELSPALKCILCADMLMGRLEIVAFLVLFYPSTWFGKKRGG